MTMSKRFSSRVISSPYSVVRRVVDVISTWIKHCACRVPFWSPTKSDAMRLRFLVKDVLDPKDHYFVTFWAYLVFFCQIWALKLSDILTTTPRYGHHLRVWGRRFRNWRVILKSSLRWDPLSAACSKTLIVLDNAVGDFLTFFLQSWAKWSSKTQRRNIFFSLPHKWRSTCLCQLQKCTFSLCARFPSTHCSVLYSGLMMTALPERRIEFHYLDSSPDRCQRLPVVRRLHIIRYVVHRCGFEHDGGIGHVDCHGYLRTVETNLTKTACYHPDSWQFPHIMLVGRGAPQALQSNTCERCHFEYSGAVPPQRYSWFVVQRKRPHIVAPCRQELQQTVLPSHWWTFSTTLFPGQPLR